MALRARLTPPRETKTDWHWHKVKSSSLRASLLFSGGRRMEAENFLASGFGTRLAIEAKSGGWSTLAAVARTWQPSRLKGIQVSREFGTPFLAATQVFDVRPIPRKWLSLDKTGDHSERIVNAGTILVTCSGNVGRATLADATIQGMLISHDLLRVEANNPDWWGWVYAYLRAPITREMMKAAQYGHIIKHLETHHMDALPIVHVGDMQLAAFTTRVKEVLEKRTRAHALTLEAENLFEKAFGPFEVSDLGEQGFVTKASAISGARRRLDAWHHNPSAKAISDHLDVRAQAWASVEKLGFDVWLPTRFKRVAASEGLELLDSSDLFEVNPDITKRIADQNFGDAFAGRVKAGWLLLSRSGQIYGVNGSAMVAGVCHEEKIVSDHIIRIAPRTALCRVGYLLMAMTHPTLGRPRVKALPYGSSIPEIEVFDVQQFMVPRLDESVEAAIADRVEEAARLRDAADTLESEIASDADEVISDFLAHKSQVSLV
ncbi:MAG: hypothetical protein H5U22_07210 [Rhizobium sp.]|nr:hypothetical protein [Rhizobium sp.]